MAKKSGEEIFLGGIDWLVFVFSVLALCSLLSASGVD